MRNIYKILTNGIKWQYIFHWFRNIYPGAPFMRMPAFRAIRTAQLAAPVILCNGKMHFPVA
jgi:hypothetical protein